MKKILLVLTILLAFIVSCGKSSDSETLKLNLKEEGKSYDPQLANDSTGEFVDSLVTETLTRQADDGKSLPGVAEKWEHNADSTVWTFHLRKNAKWSNGDPITAKDFRDGWVRALKPETAGEYADKLFYIKNAEQFNSGKIKDENQLGIKVVDDHTLEVTLNNPLTYFDSIVRIQTYAPLNKKFYDKVGEKYMTSPETSISSGVYTIKSWTRDSEIVFEKNENYWNKDNIKLKFVKALFINDPNASVNAFKNGEIENFKISDLMNIPREYQKDFNNDVESMWLFNPVSKLYLPFRKIKDAFSTCNQSTGVFLFDNWIREVRKRGVKISLQYHDEILFYLNPEDKDKISKILLESMEVINKNIKLNVPLGCSIDFGKDYAEVH